MSFRIFNDDIGLLRKYINEIRIESCHTYFQCDTLFIMRYKNKPSNFHENRKVNMCNNDQNINLDDKLKNKLAKLSDKGNFI